MPSIRVDDEVWGWLQGQARPLEDTPNSVLRRVAGLEQAVEPKSRLRRVPERTAGRKTPQQAFRRPILTILLKHGGKADRTQVLRELEVAMKDQLTTFDRQDISSGTIRWQKSAEWEVSTMRQQGILLSHAQSARGVWQLSEKGRALAVA